MEFEGASIFLVDLTFDDIIDMSDEILRRTMNKLGCETKDLTEDQLRNLLFKLFFIVQSVEESKSAELVATVKLLERKMLREFELRKHEVNRELADKAREIDKLKIDFEAEQKLLTEQNLKLTSDIEQIKFTFEAQRKSLIDKNTILSSEIDSMQIAFETERKTLRDTNMNLSSEIEQMKFAFEAEHNSLVEINKKLAFEIEQIENAVKTERTKFALEIEAERTKFALEFEVQRKILAYEFDTERKRFEDKERQHEQKLKLENLETKLKDVGRVQNSRNHDFQFRRNSHGRSSRPNVTGIGAKSLCQYCGSATHTRMDCTKLRRRNERRNKGIWNELLVKLSMSAFESETRSVRQVGVVSLYTGINDNELLSVHENCPGVVDMDVVPSALSGVTVDDQLCTQSEADRPTVKQEVSVLNGLPLDSNECSEVGSEVDLSTLFSGSNSDDWVERKNEFVCSEDVLICETQSNYLTQREGVSVSLANGLLPVDTDVDNGCVSIDTPLYGDCMFVDDVHGDVFANTMNPLYGSLNSMEQWYDRWKCEFKDIL